MAKSKAKQIITQSKPPEFQTCRYYEVAEHVPEQGQYVICYSEITGSYHIAKYNSVCGWFTITRNKLDTITHWLDLFIPLPYDIRNEYSEEIAKKYDFYMPSFFKI